MKCLAFLTLAICAVAQAEIDWSKVHPLDISPSHFNLPNVGSPKVVGGEESKPNSRPYQAALLLKIGADTAFCGGSIISSRFILTAAHCVDRASEVEVILGAHKVHEAEDTQKHYVSAKFIVHPGWNPLLLTSDIALIELAEDIEFTNEIQPIRLPCHSDLETDLTDKDAVVSGWGKDTDSATAVSPILREVQSTVMSERKCKFYYFGVTGPNHVCLTGTGGVGACSGDSGGPLVIVEDDGQLTQHGVVSFGIAFGCELGWPSAFTRVSSYLPWINENTGIEICK